MSRQDEIVMNAEARYFHRDNLPPVDEIYNQAELDVTPWYYSMEMEPGKLTPGQTFSNVGLTRALLQRADLNGQDCLDIGTMEGLLPILMQRRGARSVTAYDRPSALTSRIASVKKRFDADFDFVSGFPLAELPAKVGHRTFDVVVMSGVLYHLFSPLAGLAIARGLLRNGGLMIVETGAIISDEMVMYWNSASRFKGEAYFYPSVACLDYFARFLRMEVIDSTFLGWGTIDGLARISHGIERIGAPNQRKLFCENDFLVIREEPRCRQSVPRIFLDLKPSKAAG
jgi:SAM-dependent methyltransferase